MTGLSPNPSRQVPSQFVPLTWPTREPGELPHFLTPLVGRQREIREVRSLLSQQDVGLLTLTGIGGVGKTRLAVEVATGLTTMFSDGVVFVDLSALRDPNLVLPTIAHTLGVRESSGDQDPVEMLVRALRAKKLLLVLDNFEQVAEASPDNAEVLRGCPGLKALVTSRTILHVSDEFVFTVQPLGLPDTAQLPATPELASTESVAIFVQRAKAADPHFALTDENSPAIAAICSRLDGIPLAIELAAARAKFLSPSALLNRLERRLPLLITGSQDAPSRQRTLRNTILWSYDQLSTIEQQLFRRGSIFAGGFSLDAIEFVCSAEVDDVDSRASLLDAVTSLVEQNLIRRDLDDPPRFTLLETLREFGLEQLNGTNERDLISERHAMWFIDLAEAALSLYHGPEGALVLDRLESESDNFRSALAWTAERDKAEMALRLTYALWRFWWMHGHLNEGRTWLELALATAGAAPAEIRSRVLIATGYFARVQGDYERARTLGEEALTLAREHDDNHCIASSLDLIGLIAWGTGDYQQAAKLQAESLALDREMENMHSTALQCANLGISLVACGEPDSAEPLLRESLAIFSARGDAWGKARALFGLSRLAESREDIAGSAALLFDSLMLSREIGDKEQFADGLADLAAVAPKSRPKTAAVLLGATDALRGALSVPIAPAERDRYNRVLANMRSGLDEVSFATAWEKGRRLSAEEAIKEAGRLVESMGSSRLGAHDDAYDPLAEHGLTQREREIFALMAAGRTNGEIAEVLSISVLTVKTHVSRVLSKLGLTSRSTAVAFAHRHSLSVQPVQDA